MAARLLEAIPAPHKEAVAPLLRALAGDDERRSTMGKPGYFNDEDDDEEEEKPPGESTEDDDAGEDPEQPLLIGTTASATC